jgi:hypothetical protein
MSIRHKPKIFLKKEEEEETKTNKRMYERCLERRAIKNKKEKN